MKNNFELLESTENKIIIKTHKPIELNFLIWYFVLFVIWYTIMGFIAYAMDHTLFTIQGELPEGIFAKMIWAVTRIEFFMFIGWYMPLVLIRLYQRIYNKHFSQQLIELNKASGKITAKDKPVLAFSEIRTLSLDIRKEGYPDTTNIYQLNINYKEKLQLTLYESKDLEYSQKLGDELSKLLDKPLSQPEND